MNNYIKSPMNYTGGKYKLLPQILQFFPTEINTFVDLFTGGGNIAVNANKIIANDFEPHVIDIYKAFQNGYDSVEKIITVIESYIAKYNLSIENAEGFNNLRNDYNSNPFKSNYITSTMLYVLICFIHSIINSDLTQRVSLICRLGKTEANGTIQ